ncbi:MAG: AraC family transcriptional regulator [Acidobacteriota bacterium]|nr:AraC family transcriptional regulator [Acidobacteriota bacterium]
MQSTEPSSGKPFRFRVTDPVEFGLRLRPVAANVTAEHGGQDRFSADVRACALPHMGLFSVRIEGARVYRSPSDYLALTVPLDHELRFFDGDETGSFLPGRVHILWPSDQMDLDIAKASSLLVATYPISWLRERWRKASALDRETTPEASDCLSLSVAEGRAYWRHLNFVWSEICNGAQFLKSDAATDAIEQASAALLLLAFENGAICGSSDAEAQETDLSLEKAEVYIRTNLGEQITLADLVAVSNTSVSSLLRAFRIHRNMSPMKYVKQIRLESTQRALLAARTGVTTVTEVAMDHGFFQLGRFSADYRRVFGELPSQTLGR